VVEVILEIYEDRVVKKIDKNKPEHGRKMSRSMFR
jgi:hypothetical protein